MRATPTVNSTLTGTIMPTVLELRAGTKMKRTSIRQMGAMESLAFFEINTTPRPPNRAGRICAKAGARAGLSSTGVSGMMRMTPRMMITVVTILETAMATVDLAFLAVGFHIGLLQRVEGTGELEITDIAGDEGKVAAARAQHGHIGQRFNKSDRPVHGGGGDEAHQQTLAIGRGVEDNGNGGGEHQQQNHHRKVPDAAVVMDGIHISHICFFHGVILLSLRTASR